MGMQTDVKAGTLVESGYIYKSRTRIKGISIKCDGIGVGELDVFDTLTAPVTATYGRSGTTVTVTKSAHGLATGDQIGIAFETGAGVDVGTATSGNYTVTVLTSSTFTVTDINTGTITAGADCVYAERWIMNYRILSSDTFLNYWLIPGEGFLVENGIYLRIVNLTAASIYYG
jgi:hypothetical protein